MWVVAREELLFDFNKKAKGDTAAEGGGGNYEISETAGRGVSGGIIRWSIGYIVDEVLIVSVGEFLRSAVVDFGEDDGGKRRGLRCRGGGMLS